MLLFERQHMISIVFTCWSRSVSCLVSFICLQSVCGLSRTSAWWTCIAQCDSRGLSLGHKYCTPRLIHLIHKTHHTRIVQTCSIKHDHLILIWEPHGWPIREGRSWPAGSSTRKHLSAEVLRWSTSYERPMLSMPSPMDWWTYLLVKLIYLIHMCRSWIDDITSCACLDE